VESSAAAVPAGSAPGDKGLKKDAVNFLSSVVIGVASTAPGYSLAATLGFVVAAVGFQSPAVLWLAFVPMLCVATAYLYMNKADPDCGTTFAWVGKAMGPWTGWMAGWAIIVADIIVMANLAQIAGLYSFLLFDSNADPSTAAVTAIGVIWIAVMTLICYLGTELSARMQRYLLTAEVLTLAAFAIVALVKVYGGDALDTSVKPELSWFSPFAIDSTSALTAGVLLSVFIYWGWDSAVSVNEETEDSAEAPGRSAIWSTIILVLIYLIVSTAAIAFGGPEQLADQEEVLNVLGTQVFGSPFDKILIIAVLTSAAASTQTTILPTARTSLSMARAKAMPASLGNIHEKYLTPSTSTMLMGALSIAWYVGLTIVSENILFDSIAALGLMIAFYYGLSGFACSIYYRREIMREGSTSRAAGLALIFGTMVLTLATLIESNFVALIAAAFLVTAAGFGYAAAKDWKAFTLVGALPAVGGVILTYVFFKSVLDYSHPENSESGDSWLGLGPPLVIGVGFLLLGALLMLWWSRGNPDFFRTKASVFQRPADPAPAPAAGGS
jgi:amino acid transporter